MKKEQGAPFRYMGASFVSWEIYKIMMDFKDKIVQYGFLYGII